MPIGKLFLQQQYLLLTYLLVFEKLLFRVIIAGCTVLSNAFIINTRIAKVEEKVNILSIKVTKIDGKIDTLTAVYVPLEHRITVAEQDIKACQKAQWWTSREGAMKA